MILRDLGRRLWTWTKARRVVDKNLIVAGKFDLKNTVINIVAGLGLLSFITMFCDFVLLNYVKERKIVSILTKA